LDGGQSDPQNQIVLLEERMEELAAKVESCRKFILASRIAVLGGAVVLAGMLFGVMMFDPAVLAGGVAALLGGIVVGGSNGSTAKEAAKELAAAEAARSVLIETMDLSDVTPSGDLANQARTAPSAPPLASRTAGGRQSDP
jgi:hypothetical protein